MPTSPHAENPVRLRARRTLSRARAMGVSMVQIARAIGKGGSESEVTYVRQVLRGEATSDPVTTAAEEYLDALESQPRAKSAA